MSLTGFQRHRRQLAEKLRAAAPPELPPSASDPAVTVGSQDGAAAQDAAAAAQDAPQPVDPSTATEITDEPQGDAQARFEALSAGAGRKSRGTRT